MELTNFVLKNCCYTVDYVKHVPNNNTNIKLKTHITYNTNIYRIMQHRDHSMVKCNKDDSRRKSQILGWRPIWVSNVEWKDSK